MVQQTLDTTAIVSHPQSNGESEALTGEIILDWKSGSFNPSPVELYPFQKDMHQRVIDRWTAGVRKIALQMATGTGKTEIAAAEVKRRQKMGHPDIIFVVHRDDLVDQTTDRFRGYDIKCVAGSGSFGQWKQGKPRPPGVVVMGILTLRNRIKKNPDAIKGAFLIIDEMHWYPHGDKWGSVIANHDGQVLGLSATPYRMGIDETFSPTWDELICGPSIPQMVEQDYLAPVVMHDIPSFVKGIPLTRKADIKMSQDGYDHTAIWEHEKELEQNAQLAPRVYETATSQTSTGSLTRRAVEIWHQQAVLPHRDVGGLRTVVFALTVEHAYRLKELFHLMRGAPENREV